MKNIQTIIRSYLAGDLDRVEFNNLLRDYLGEIEDQEHRDFVKVLAKAVEQY